MHAHLVMLPGDGIGPEVLEAAAAVLRVVARRFGHAFDLQEMPIGGVALRAGQPPLPGETLDACLSADAVLLGAVGDAAFDHDTGSRRPEAGLLELRRALGVYANLRPARAWPGLEDAGPVKPAVLAGTDLCIVRELTGGLYYGEPRGIAADGASAFNTLRYSHEEIARVAHVAFTIARRRRRLVTSVDKANVLETSRLWRSVVSEVAKGYPDVRLEHAYVDACAMKVALAPASFDVILTENLFGDILSDEAGAVCGSIGLLPSASIGDGPGLFEPVHGSAPDIAGRDVANPIGAIGSAAMLLRYGLKLEVEAAAVEAAIEQALVAGCRTADLAASGERALSGSEMARAITNRVQLAGIAAASAPADPRHPPVA